MVILGRLPALMPSLYDIKMNDENPIYYYKINNHDIERGMFCSWAVCEKEFESNEVVVLQNGNTFHIACFKEVYPDIKIHVLRD